MDSLGLAMDRNNKKYYKVVLEYTALGIPLFHDNKDFLSSLILQLFTKDNRGIKGKKNKLSRFEQRRALCLVL